MSGTIFVLIITSLHKYRKNVKGVKALVNNRESTCFLITLKEEKMLRQIRELSEADRKEIERRFLEIAVKYAEWSK